MLAFLPAVASAPVQLPETKPQLPVFKPRWWHTANRLDVRPVIWSLDNHPEEWEIDSSPPHIFTHKPSNHRFMMGVSYMWQAECSCHHRAFQLGQRLPLKWAMKRWLQQNRPQPNVNVQFASHFIHE